MEEYYDIFYIHLKSEQFRNETNISTEHLAVFHTSAAEMSGGNAFSINQSAWPLLRLSIYPAFALAVVVFVHCVLHYQLDSYLENALSTFKT